MQWIKIEDIPKEFWGECFVGWMNMETGLPQVDPSIVMVRRFDLEAKWYCDSLKEWFEFRSDLQYKVMIIKFPKLGKEEFV